MNVDEIIKGFQEAWISKSSEYMNEPNKIQKLSDDVKSFVNKSGLEKVCVEIQLLAEYLKDIASGSYNGYSGTNLAIAIAAIIYVVSPLDVIPDAIPLLGFTDDAAVIAWAVAQLHEELEKYKEWK